MPSKAKPEELEKSLSQIRQGRFYSSIRFCTEEYGYPAETLCKILHVSRPAYYKWLCGKPCARQAENERIEKLVEKNAGSKLYHVLLDRRKSGYGGKGYLCTA
jgi:hypothetical protein